MKLASILVVSIALAGCATEAKFREVMTNHIGLSEGDLVAGYGPPNNSYTLPDGSKVLQFTQGSTVTVPGITTTVPVTTYGTGTVNTNTGRSAYYSGSSTSYVQQQGAPMSFERYCTVNFTLVGGKVTRWSATGTSCKSN